MRRREDYEDEGNEAEGEALEGEAAEETDVAGHVGEVGGATIGEPS